MPERAVTTVLSASEPSAISDAVAAMDAGGIVGMPTETVYGIGVLPRPEALAALVEAKRRPLDKGIALLIDGLDQVEALVVVDQAAERLAQRFWPGALTLVLPLRRPEMVPPVVSGGRDTLGLRVPDHPVPRALARQLGPIAVTSGNLTGEPAARTADELVSSVGASLALVLDDGPVRGGVASTVVAISMEGGLTVLREGAVQSGEIEAVAEGG